MKIAISNQQKHQGIDRIGTRKLIRFLMENATTLAPSFRWGEVTVLFTDDAGITNLNREYFGENGPTDVISFAFAPMPGESSSTAEIIVNAERAILEAKGRKSWSAAMELALYVAHGCDHAHGANDDTPIARRRMVSRETAWVKKALSTGLLPTAFSRQPRSHPAP